MENGKLFQGGTRARARVAVTYVLKHLREKHGFERVVVPCCGQFSLVACALEAGFTPQSIEASDVSLFSSLLGELFCGRNPRQLGYEVAEPWRKVWEALDGKPLAQTAFVLWVMKVIEARQRHGFFNDLFTRNFEARKKDYRAALKSQLAAARSRYRGIEYKVRDLNEVLKEDLGEKTIVLVDPPFTKAESRGLQDVTGTLRFEPKFVPWLWKVRHNTDYLAAMEQRATHIWLHTKDTSGIPKHQVFFAQEVAPGKLDQWTITKPELLPERYTLVLEQRKEKRVTPAGGMIVPPDYRITPQTRIGLKEVSREIAMWYRDLWAHKLGTTDARQFFLVFLDDYVFGTFGINSEFIYLFKSEYTFEEFGFSAHLKYHPMHNRLLMMTITSEQFGRYLKSRNKKNRIYNIKGLKTTCITKYRTNKSNNGLLEVVSREKLENGMYKLSYRTDFWPRNFEQVVADYLEYEKTKTEHREAHEQEAQAHADHSG